MDAEWVEALPLLRQKFGERNFSTWIEPIRCSRDEHGLRLEVSSRFFQEWVTRHFLPRIREALSATSGTVSDVRVVVVSTNGEAPPPPPKVEASATTPSRPQRTPKIGRLVPEYTFDTFVVGQSNEVAYRAAHSVGECPGRRFNPFFLWGGVGLGKTHLVNALAHDLLARPPRPRMACLAAEAFMNSLITSLRQDQMAAFRDRFREVDVLILDDVEFLAGKERTQEEFFHTFNALYAAGKQVVLTSDKPPHAITGLEERLRSRFEGGLIADIHPPTQSMRVAIVTKKAAAQGVVLPAEVASALAQRSGPSVRELEGALTRVLATSALKAVTLDRELVERVLMPITRPANVPSPDAILDVVCHHFRLTVGDLKSHRRARSVAFPRQLAMYLVRTVTDVSFPSIGDLFGGRDHSTVMHAVRTIEAKRAHDPRTDALVATIETEVRARTH